jgi:DNA-binding transcriptional LysR family regulator
MVGRTLALDDIDVLRSLRCFCWVIELASFSAAARQLGLTPAAVSKQIGVLESVLACALFRRTTRQLMPTEEARRLYERIKPAVQAMLEALAQASAPDVQMAGPLRVSMPMAFSRQAVLPQLGRFRALHPGVSLDLRFDNHHVDLVAEGFDCAIGNLSDPDSATLIARPLLPIARVLCAAPAYLARRGTPQAVAELAAHELLLFRSPSSGRVQPWHLRHGGEEHVLNPQGMLRVSDTEALLRLALAGQGIALLGVHHALEHFGTGELVQLLPGCQSRLSDICIYYSAQRQPAPRLSAFVEFIVEAVRDGEFARAVRAFLAADEGG